MLSLAASTKLRKRLLSTEEMTDLKLVFSENYLAGKLRQTSEARRGFCIALLMFSYDP